MKNLPRQIGLVLAACWLLLPIVRADELPAPIEPVPVQADPLIRWGTPEGTVYHEADWCFALDGRTRLARWALEYVRGRAADEDDRDHRFFPDVRIPSEFRATLADYRGTPFDRGHLVPVANLSDPHARAATFSLANVAPQSPPLNRGLWRSLEQHIRSLPNDQTEVWCITVPVWKAVEGQVSYPVLGTNAVAVPTHFAKSVLTVPSEVEITMTTWLAPNTVPKAGTTIADWRITTDELERLAGLDLWAGLPDEIETQLEAPK